MGGQVIDRALEFVGYLRLVDAQLDDVGGYDLGAVWPAGADRMLLTVEVQGIRYNYYGGAADSTSTPIAAGGERWFVLEQAQRTAFKIIRQTAGAIAHCEFFKAKG